MVELKQHDQSRLATFCRRSSDFFEMVGGQPGGPTTAAEILGPLPENVTSGTKRVFGIERSGELIGVAELLDGFPGPKDWYVGLLVLLPDLRKGRIGTDVWVGLRNWIQEREAAVVRVVVQKQNASARTFWERQGFTVEGEIVLEVARLERPAWRMLLHLARAARPGVTPGGRLRGGRGVAP